MAADEIHVGDIGTVFTITIYDGTTAVDISSASFTSTARQLLFRKPDGTISTQTAALTSGGTNGSLSFTAPSTLFDSDGTWKVQAVLMLGTSTATYHSDIYIFRVYPNLQ